MTETPLTDGRPADTRGGEASPGLLGRIDRDMRTAIALLAISFVLIVASRALGPNFGSLTQMKAILVISSFLMVVAFGQQMVILLGGLDLSVASMMTLGGVLAFKWIGGPSASSVLWGVPAILLITAALGACSGIGVSLVKIPPFIMTLAMGVILYGVTLGFTQGTPTGQPSAALSSLFATTAMGTPILYLMVLGTAAGCFLQIRTSFGRKVYALGTNPTAAFVAGLPVHRLTIAAHAISGASAGLAGILMLGYVRGVTLTLGQSYLLPSVAAVVVGGTSIVGGRGIYLGAAAGAILLTTLSTLVSSLGIAEGWRTIIYGVVIFLALVLLRDDLMQLIKRSGFSRSTPRSTPQSSNKQRE
ncbi:Sugar ABC transporter permease [Pararobbsia alpina]|uniref:ABC transporter permease n=1 Tax=Pararobbsia alpina TaxID=621374 RepID=UPI0039A41BE1